MNFTASEVRTYWATVAPDLKPLGREMRGPCPIHNGKGLNFSVNTETGFAYCHSQCGRGWDIYSFEMERTGSDFPRAKDYVYELLGGLKSPGKTGTSKRFIPTWTNRASRDTKLSGNTVKSFASVPGMLMVATHGACVALLHCRFERTRSKRRIPCSSRKARRTFSRWKAWAWWPPATLAAPATSSPSW